MGQITSAGEWPSVNKGWELAEKHSSVLASQRNNSPQTQSALRGQSPGASVVTVSLMHIGFPPVWVLSLPHRASWDHSQKNHLNSNPFSGSALGKTQTKAACTIGHSSQGQVWEAVGKKCRLICSTTWVPRVGYHTPHFNLVLAPCWQPTVRAGQSLVGLPSAVKHRVPTQDSGQ